MNSRQIPGVTVHIGVLGAGTALLLFAYHVGLGLSAKYSYWFDELFSVVTSNAGLGRVFEFTFNDVHPPLYQFVLWLWIKLFGDAESATRALSTIFAVISFGVLATLRRSLGLGPTLLVVAFYAAHPHIHLYAQETRSYSMLALFSCMCMVGLVNDNRRLVYVSALLLGLSHFFGALLGTLALVYLVWRQPTRGSVLSSALFFSLIAFWPAAQILVGSSSELAGGNFWIQTGARDAIAIGAWAAWPGLVDGIRYVCMILGVNPFGPMQTSAFLVFPAMIGLIWLHLRNTIEESDALAIAIGGIGCVVLVVAAISLHTPVATSRNFIVLAPFGALSLAILVSRGLSANSATRGATMILFLVYGYFVGERSVNGLYDRIHSEQSYREIVLQAEKIAHADDLPIFHYGGSDEFFKLIYEFYLPIRAHTEQLPQFSSVAQIPDSFILLFLNSRCVELSERIETLRRTRDITVIAGAFNEGCNYSSGALKFENGQ